MWPVYSGKRQRGAETPGWRWQWCRMLQLDVESESGLQLDVESESIGKLVHLSVNQIGLYSNCKSESWLKLDIQCESFFICFVFPLFAWIMPTVPNNINHLGGERAWSANQNYKHYPGQKVIQSLSESHLISERMRPEMYNIKTIAH